MTRRLRIHSLLPLATLGALVACSRGEPTAESRALELAEEVQLAEVETTESPPLQDLSALEPVAVTVEVVLEEPAELPPSFETVIRSGENLVLLADWAEVSVEELLVVNAGLDPTEPLFPGQSLSIPLPDEEEHVFQANRQAFVDAKLERYMERRGGLVGLTEYRVRTGDTAWGLATNEADVPMWVLSEFNRDSDLGRLSIGERLTLPVLGDTIDLAMDEEPEEPSVREEVSEPVEEPAQPRLEPLAP